MNVFLLRASLLGIKSPGKLSVLAADNFILSISAITTYEQIPNTERYYTSINKQYI